VRKETEWSTKAKELEGEYQGIADELKEFAWPQRGCQAELASLLLQAGKHRIVAAPKKRKLMQAVETTLKKYPGVDNSLSLNLQEEVEQAMDTVKPESSPGVPWSQFGKSNEALFASHYSLIQGATVERIELLLSTPLEELRKKSAVELVQQGYVDPIRIFTKNEPHKTDKILQKKFRLICSVSIVDQLIERVMAWRQNALEIANWETIPSKPGIGFDDDRNQSVWDSVFPLLEKGQLAEGDVSGWDWSVQAWELEQEAEMRIRLGACSRMAQLIRARMYCLSLSVFALSSGELLAQTSPGVMKSGSYITSSGNSRIRVLAAELIGADCIAMGDDSLETYVWDAKNQYKMLGHDVKLYELCGDSFGFCSNRYKDGIAYPESAARTLFRLLNQKLGNATTDEERVKRLDLFMQFTQEMRHHPKLVLMQRLISEVGWLSDV
jgi:hypothetical protein